MATPAVLNKLGALTAIPFGDAARKFELNDVTDGDWHVDDIVGEEPETVLVRKGNAKIAGDVDLTQDVDHTVCVVDGDLAVGGTLSLIYGPCNLLYVTGNVRAKHLVLHGEVHLWIGGSLEVDGFILDELDDGGHLRVHGATQAKAIVFWGRGESRVHDKTPTAQVIAVDALPEPYSGADQGTIARAIAKGKDILAAPAAPEDTTPSAPAGERETWKSTGPIVTKMKPAEQLAKLAKWKPIAIDDAGKRFNLAAVCNSARWKDHLNFRDTPKPVYAFVGDVHVASLRVEDVVKSPAEALYVIVGDLVVDDSLIIAFSFGALAVTGDVRARHVVITEAALWVGGDLEASEFVLSDHHLHVGGTLRSKALVIEWIMPEVTRPPEARILINAKTKKPVKRAPPNPAFFESMHSEPLGDALVPEMAGKNMYRLAEAFRAGHQILRADP